jgi:hypothetical protein
VGGGGGVKPQLSKSDAAGGRRSPAGRGIGVYESLDFLGGALDAARDPQTGAA